MDLRLEIEFSKTEIIKEVGVLKKQLDALRPFPPDVEGKVFQKLRLDWNYNSNAIEGNKLNYGETVAFLMEGITAKGKPLKDHLDIRGHNAAIDFLLELVKDTRLITESDIRNLHEIILVEPYDSPAKTADGLPTVKRITLGQYKTSPNHVKTSTGEIHYYATPEETPAKMQALMEWYEAVEQNSEVYPVVIAALFHHKFVEIHPFDDGNGRLSRILMNLILMRHGYPPVVVKMDDRKNYYSLLSRADVGDDWPFVEYITELAKSSLELYLKAINGGDITEEEDIDKKITLFRMGLKSKIEPQKEISSDEIEYTFFKTILPSLLRISNKLQLAFHDFFEYINFTIVIGQSNILLNNNTIEDINNSIKKALGKTKVSSVTFNVDLMEFKQKLNSFDTSISVDIDFTNEDYFVHDIDKLEIVKMYYEDLTREDQDNIIQEMIERAEWLINFNLN